MTMPITETEAKGLIKRLYAATGIHGADGDERAARRQEIGAWLQEYAQTYTHAEEIIARAQQNFDEFPSKAQLCALAARVTAKLIEGRRQGCKECRYTGFVYTEMFGQTGGFLGLRYRAVKRCPCSGGAV